MSNNFTIPSQYNPTINRKIQCAAFDVNAFENYIINSKAIYRIMSIRARYRLFDRNTNVSFRRLKFVKYNHRFRNRSAISPIVCVNHVVSNEEISLFILFILFFFLSLWNLWISGLYFDAFVFDIYICENVITGFIDLREITFESIAKNS